ncbi:MAG: hypothetical protein FJX71_04645 [Alphaproteobacteria bacterium]|nr:hypothetical protein [Alphaproteobacteria bacterium]
MKKLILLSFLFAYLISTNLLAAEVREMPGEQGDRPQQVTQPLESPLEVSDKGEELLDLFTDEGGTADDSGKKEALEETLRCVVNAAPPKGDFTDTPIVFTGSKARSYWDYVPVPSVATIKGFMSYMSFRGSFPAQGKEAPTSTSIAAPSTGVVSVETKSSEQTEIEEFLKLVEATPTINDVPVEIFFKDLKFMTYIGIITKYKLTSFAGGLANLFNTINPLRLYNPLAMITAPAISGFANNVAQGDMDNFPPIPLQYLADLLKDISDRKAFAKLPLTKRSFLFRTEGKTLTGKGYDGYAVIVDFAFGRRLVDPNDEPKAIAANADGIPLNSLVALEELIRPYDWLGRHFVLPGTMNLRKIRGTFDKDEFGNTWGIYECFADPESFMVQVMREPKEKYERRVKLWQNAWKLKHPDVQS